MKIQKTGDVRLDAIVRNPAANAVASKLVVDINRGRFTRSSSGGESMPGVDVLGKISSGITRNITDANNILETLPDVERAMQIMVSGILSPSDLRSPKLTYALEDTTLDSALTADLLKLIQEHFGKSYKIEEWFPDALEDALFKTGSYPLMIVPENSLDDIINNKTASLEAFVKSSFDSNMIAKPMGLLGAGLTPTKRNKTKVQSMGLESFFAPHHVAVDQINSRVTAHVHVTDNYMALKLPLLVKRSTQSRATAAIWRGSNIAASLEAAGDLSKMSNAIFHRRNFQAKEIVRIRPASQATRAPIGHPLVMKLPSESCIPVHVPSNPKDHLGYYILMDEYGYPMSNAMESTYYQDLNNAMQANRESSEASKMLQQSKYFTSGANCAANGKTINSLVQAYSEIVEKDLLERLKNGYLGEAVEIARPEEVYRIMFARSLAGRQTMLLYVPAELVTYVAFDYNRVGIGRSLLDKSKILAAIRATLMFANTMAAIKNSTARQSLVIELDEADVDPEGTVEYLLTEFVKLQSGAKIAATTNPLEIVDGIQRANISVAVSGNPDYPETKVSVEDAQSQRVQIDNDFNKGITSQLWMSFGLAPEIIDDMQRVEFAASQITSNALMTKTFALYQAIFCRFISDHIRKYSLNSGKLLGEMIKIIRKYKNELKDSTRVKTVDQVKESLNAVDLPDNTAAVYTVKEADVAAKEELEADVFDIINEFLNALQAVLPPPDDNRIESQAEAFSQYSDLLDKVLEIRLSDDVLDSILGEAQKEHKQALRTAVKATYQRRYLIRNNVLPELEDLKVKESGEEGETVVDEYISYIDEIATTITDLVEKIKNKNNPDDQAAAEDTGGTLSDTDGFDSTGGESDTMADTDSSIGGGSEGAEFDLGDDLNL